MLHAEPEPFRGAGRVDCGGRAALRIVDEHADRWSATLTEQGNRFLLTSHINPDGDAIGEVTQARDGARVGLTLEVAQLVLHLLVDLRLDPAPVATGLSDATGQPLHFSSAAGRVAGGAAVEPGSGALVVQRHLYRFGLTAVVYRPLGKIEVAELGGAVHEVGEVRRRPGEGRRDDRP